MAQVERLVKFNIIAIEPETVRRLEEMHLERETLYNKWRALDIATTDILQELAGAGAEWEFDIGRKYLIVTPKMRGR